MKSKLKDDCCTEIILFQRSQKRNIRFVSSQYNISSLSPKKKYITNEIDKTSVNNINPKLSSSVVYSQAYKTSENFYKNDLYFCSNQANGSNSIMQGLSVQQSQKYHLTSNAETAKTKSRNGSIRKNYNKNTASLQRRPHNVLQFKNKENDKDKEYMKQSCDVWNYLKDYVSNNSSKHSQQNTSKVKEEIHLSESKYRTDSFPYHSYLKHKKNELELANLYIITTGAKYRTKIDEGKVHNSSKKRSYELSKPNKSVFTRENKNVNEITTLCRNNLASTTAKILNDRYKTFYDKIEMDTIKSPSKISKVQTISPFHNYLEDLHKRKAMAINLRRKNHIEITSPKQTNKIQKENDKEVVYIGSEDFPLSVYERSKI